MNPTELRAGVSLAGVFGLRMLGLFFILPVFAVHAPRMRGGDDLTLVGLALGAYGLAQGVLQIPFGLASDRWGRKPMLYAGLAVFAAGSFLGMVADDIWTAIAARTLQGAGAISSVAMALAADLTREHHRTKVMAMIGSTIGLMFALSLVGAPPLYRVIGMEGLFALNGLLCLAAMVVVKVLVPDPPPPAARASRGSSRDAVLHPELLRLNAGILVLHIVLYAMFLVVPTRLVEAGLELPAHWKFYLPVVLASFVLMVPPILYADRRNRPKPVLLGAVAMLVAALGPLGAASSVSAIAGLMLVFFIAFNALEAILPSLVSRVAPAEGRGVAIGVYNTTQTLGVFFGGLIGGWLAKHFGAGAVFATCTVLCILWFVIAAGMHSAPRPVNDLSSLTFPIRAGADLEALRATLSTEPGVREAVVLADERIAHLKVVPGQCDESRLRKLVMGEN
jgi:MFS family permease